MNPKTVIRTMRAIRRDQVTDLVNKDVAKYIFDNGLMEIHRWPAFVITITDVGFDYIREHDEPDYE
jgi:hypothetical protein